MTAVAPKIPLTSIHVTLVRGFLGATGLSHLGPNVTTLGPLLHLGHLLHVGLQRRMTRDA